MADWSEIVELSPVATLLIARIGADDRQGRIRYANAAARVLCGNCADAAGGQKTLFDVVEPAAHSWLEMVLDRHASVTPASLPAESTSRAIQLIAPWTESSGLGQPDQTAPAFTLRLQSLSNGDLIAQLTTCDGWEAVDGVLAEQQRFRGALMELSELAHTTQDDDDFYQRLIERAVEVVPGAEGGSVQLNVPGTASFNFVAAVGYDLQGLQRHLLEPADFFRDAWDPTAQIVRDFGSDERSDEIAEWLETVGRLHDIVVNVSAPVLVEGSPVAFLSLDNFTDPAAMTETSIEMTTVLSRLIGELWRRRDLEAAVRKEREAFRHQALHDPLTGLPNRRNLERSLLETLATSRRGNRPGAVLFVDVDDFKGVNDRLGHEVGDLVLMGVAKGLNDVVRAGDVVGRWGGDEFLFVPHRLESEAQAGDLALRILDYFDGELDLGGGLMYRLRLTVGIGWSDDSQVNNNELVRLADEALYEAKAAGKGMARLRRASD